MTSQDFLNLIYAIAILICGICCLQFSKRISNLQHRVFDLESKPQPRQEQPKEVSKTKPLPDKYLIDKVLATRHKLRRFEDVKEIISSPISDKKSAISYSYQIIFEDGYCDVCFIDGGLKTDKEIFNYLYGTSLS